MAETTCEETSIVEKTGTQIKECKEEDLHFHVRPEYYSTVDPETSTWEAEIYLPGVPKEQVKVKVLPELFDLEARRGRLVYSLTEYFPYEVDVKTLTARHENGLLSLKGKIVDPLSRAVELKVE